MASRKEKKEALREQRLAAERAAADDEFRRRIARYIVNGVLGAVAAAGVVVLIVTNTGGGGVAQSGGEFPRGSIPRPRRSELGAAAKAAGCSIKDFPSEGSDHVYGSVRYASKPPHSGNHNQVPADDFAYVEAPPMENLVHSLEHGRVIVWYSPALAAKSKGELKALFDEDPYHMIFAPNRDMPVGVAVSAWTNVLACPRMSPSVFDAIRAFRSRYRDRGPESVP